MSEPRADRTKLLVLPPHAASFLRVAGLTVMERVLLAAQRAGFAEIVVWTPEPCPRLATILRAHSRLRGVQLTAEPPFGDDPWVVVRSDVVVSPTVLLRIRAESGGGAVRWCVDGLVVAVSGSARQLFPDSGTDAVAAWADAMRLADTECSLSTEVAVPVASPTSAQQAERALCRQIWRAAAATDGVLAHWFDRRLSLAISRRLARFPWLRPNHVTAAGTALGLCAAWLFSHGSFTGGVAAAVLFWLACVLDGCDGELARLTFRDSEWGKFFDVATDNLVHAAIFLGLGLGFLRSHPHAPHGWLVLLLLGGFASAGLASYVFLNRACSAAVAGAATHSWRGRLERFLAALMNRDFSYLLLLLALADRLHWFLWGAAFGSYAVAAAALALSFESFCGPGASGALSEETPAPAGTAAEAPIASWPQSE
ncbi:MAG: CDP-alcohol phosphatidyltransferase family protein [Candidatus Binatia bacterium]|nr:CDP-alcohol phosphatidyltransferase family protein [Candidatus Binatia bacterium]